MNIEQLETGEVTITFDEKEDFKNIEIYKQEYFLNQLNQTGGKKW
jgi:hypothetical protein